jgi:hypothetical protein
MRLRGRSPMVFRRRARNEVKSTLLDASIIVRPSPWLVSPEADEMMGRRLVATKWLVGSSSRPQKPQRSKRAGNADSWKNAYTFESQQGTAVMARAQGALRSAHLRGIGEGALADAGDKSVRYYL